MRKSVLSMALLGLCSVLALPSCMRQPASGGTGDTEGLSSFETKYTDIILGETALDLEASILLLSQRTDMVSPEYGGRTWNEYIKEFNSMYPGIRVSVEAVSDYDNSAKDMLDGGNWGDVMMIPITDKKLYSQYYIPFGTVEELSRSLRFVDQYSYDGRVYGIASAGIVHGILYNKRVFVEAGVKSLPRTPDEFLDALRLVKKNTGAIPLYTNYAAGWPLTQWDYYISCVATGDSSFLNHTLVHTKEPFSDPGDGSGPYNVYRILYQAVAEGLTEDDFTITDWESCKGMMNRGDIAAMALGSWVVSQVQRSGPNFDDIGYMPFPMLVDGVQVAAAMPDSNFGINVRSSGKKKLASMIFVKWMVERSGFQFDEGELPVLFSDDKIAEVYRVFDGMEIMVDAAPFDNEEDLLTNLNAISGLGISQQGYKKVRRLIEHAAAGDMTFDEIMDSWNLAWSRAQETVAERKE